jgi:hypothetical protein
MSRIKISVRINGSVTDYFVNAGTTSGDLARDRGFKEDLALGENIKVLVNGSESSRTLRANDIVTVQTVASQKAAPRTKLRVTANGTVSDYFVPAGTTAGSLNNDRGFKEDLALGSNIKILVNGVEAPSGQRLASGDQITVQTVASQKAA